MADAIICEDKQCDDEARVTIKTTRHERSREMKTTIWWDERTGPKYGDRYCKRHGAALITALADTLIDEG